MAKKYKVIGNSFIMEDTISGVIEMDKLAKDIYFDNNALNEGYILINQKDRVRNIFSAIGIRVALADSVDKNDVVFTEATFRRFFYTQIIEKSQELPLSAFGDLRTTELAPQLQQSFEYTVGNTDLTVNASVNGGTITQASGMAVLTSSTTTASSAKLRSKQHAKYRSGLGGLARFTALFTDGVVGTEQFIGIMDEAGSSEAFKNGYGIGFNGDVFSVLRFQNDVLFDVAQSDWDDPLDGTGESGIVFDHTKLNVFQINYQYLGAGAINFYIQNPSTGGYVLFHIIKYSNTNILPSTFNPNYHFTLWVDNKGTTDNMIMKSSSFAYFMEGSTSFIELHQPQNSTGIKSKTTVTSEVAIFTIRNKSSYVSKTNFIDIFLEHITASIEASAANNLGSVRLVKNATLGGTPSYADISTSNSVVEIDVAGTTVTGGVDIFPAPLAGKNDRILERLTDYKIILNPGETVTLAGVSANSATIEGSLLWKELF